MQVLCSGGRDIIDHNMLYKLCLYYVRLCHILYLNDLNSANKQMTIGDTGYIHLSMSFTIF